MISEAERNMIAETDQQVSSVHEDIMYSILSALEDNDVFLLVLKVILILGCSYLGSINDIH